MALKIEDLLDDIRKVRNDLVAQANPHFQSLTNIIYKWETKLVKDTPEYKQQKEMEEKEEQLERFKQREQEERENLERISREAKEEDNLKEMAKQWPEYTLEELKKEQALADDTEKFKEKDEN